MSDNWKVPACLQHGQLRSDTILQPDVACNCRKAPLALTVLRGTTETNCGYVRMRRFVGIVIQQNSSSIFREHDIVFRSVQPLHCCYLPLLLNNRSQILYSFGELTIMAKR